MAEASVPDAVAKERLRLWLRMLRCTTRIENHLRQRLRTNFGITLPSSICWLRSTAPVAR